METIGRGNRNLAAKGIRDVKTDFSRHAPYKSDGHALGIVNSVSVC